MGRLKAIIIDDELGSIQSLKWELEAFSDQVELIDSFQLPSKAIQFLNENTVDVVFLDIEMPEMNGFDFIKSFSKVNFHVIFTTAYDEYAIDAFKISAIDYLLKPIDEDEIRTALGKIQKAESTSNFQEQLNVLMENINLSNPSNKKIVFPVLEGLEFVKINDIIRCQSDSNYTHIHIVDKKPLLVSKTLKDIEAMLDGSQFFRVHNSHLINVNFIQKYLKGKAGSVVLNDGTNIPISRSRKGGFLDQF
ncbi:LytTR family DNA-binding domain-containing protein [Saprospiraceae bacterium]|nr:LytTR family DNA-binding domain-containing protein [Saprospiraceae bacterium]